MNISIRLERLERQLTASPGLRRCLSHAQLVRAAAAYRQGEAFSEIPEVLVPVDQPSHADLILQTVHRAHG
jgi:hypothetical protein